MADISEVKLPNGSTYDLKDAWLRDVVDNLEVGGRNLLCNTEWTSDSIAKFGANNATLGNAIGLWRKEPNAVVAMDESGLMTLTTSSTTRYGIYQDVVLETGRYVFSGQIGSRGTVCIGPAQWPAPQSRTTNGRFVQIIDVSSSATYRVYVAEANGNVSYVNWLKLERGNTPTDWTPASEDYVKKSGDTMYYNLTAPKFIGALQGNADTATTAGNVTGTVAIANGGTGATSAANARTNLGVPPTSHASSATTYGTGTDANYGHVKLSGATNSTSGTSGGIAATPSAVKTAYDLANTANGTANTALSGVNGTLIYDHTYTIANGVATFTAHVYCKGEEVTSQYADSAFSWSYRLSDAISETGTPSVVSLGTGKTKTINITTLGLGGHVIGTFTTD